MTELLLYIGRKRTDIVVFSDLEWPGMWRIRNNKTGYVSDMVNLSRAKNAAIIWAEPRGLTQDEIAYWRPREMGLPASPVRHIPLPCRGIAGKFKKRSGAPTQG